VLVLSVLVAVAVTVPVLCVLSVLVLSVLAAVAVAVVVVVVVVGLRCRGPRFRGMAGAVALGVVVFEAAGIAHPSHGAVQIAALLALPIGRLRAFYALRPRGDFIQALLLLCFVSLLAGVLEQCTRLARNLAAILARLIAGSQVANCAVLLSVLQRMQKVSSAGSGLGICFRCDWIVPAVDRAASPISIRTCCLSGAWKPHTLHTGHLS
jgi:hypothetical protein